MDEQCGTQITASHGAFASRMHSTNGLGWVGSDRIGWDRIELDWPTRH
jgi:hypothetical protein